MSGRLITGMVAPMLFWATTVQAAWITLDEFGGAGPLGSPKWTQVTPLQNFQQNGRLFAVGKAMAIYQNWPLDGEPQQIQVTAYSGQPNVGTRDGSAQTLSLILGAKDIGNYYEVRLLADNVLTTDFYRLHFYHMVNGVETRDKTVNLATTDALRMEAILSGSGVSVTLQPIDRLTGGSLGSSLTYNFEPIPSFFVTDPNARRVGLAAQGAYVEMDNFQGFVAPEPVAAMLLLVALPLVRTRRRR